MASPSERVLVTGAAGFTGRHLCAHLREHGYRVFGLVEHAPAIADEVEADLLDASARCRSDSRGSAGLRRPSRGDRLSRPRARRTPSIASTSRGTLALLEALAREGGGRKGVLLPSTGTVYAKQRIRAVEDGAARAGHALRRQQARDGAHGAAVTRDRCRSSIVRPFNYTGPGQREPYLVPKIVRHFAERADVIELGNVDVERDFLDVRIGGRRVSAPAG